MPDVPRMTRGYEQVADHYRSLIRRGRLSPGDKFPPVREIAEKWGISTNTANHAVQQLREEGWIGGEPRYATKVIGVPGDSR